MLTTLLFHSPAISAYHHSPSGNAAPSMNADLDTLFQYTTSRNHKVISQAVEFVVSMQTAPTCTRMAASHLMNECKLLENAPEFAKTRPEAYLDNVKTEYAAKLAVCELLSAQPHTSNPLPPAHCDIFVPSSRACGKGGSWWYNSKPTTSDDKQCYPDFNGYQYSQCLKTLQSSPQYWTSFSNARQNAVVMCQASRDAIERENHLEIFKNLTQVMSAVSSTMKDTTEEYESLVRDQKEFANAIREAQEQAKQDIQDVHDKAIATVGSLDNKFHSFMDISITGLIQALTQGQSDAIIRIREEMQLFSQDMILESSGMAKSLTGELQKHHDRALISLQINHEAQLDSYNVLSDYMGEIHHAAMKINHTTNSSLTKIDTIQQRLETLSSRAEHIANGFAFFSGIPDFITSLVRTLIATAGILFLFALLYKFSRKLAVHTAGACSSAYLLHICGVYQWLGNAFSRTADAHAHSQRILPSITDLSATQRGAAIILLLWACAYPVSQVNSFFGHLLGTTLNRLLSAYWIRQYQNEGGVGFLPSVEIPDKIPQRMVDLSGNNFRPIRPLGFEREASCPVEA
ncbi:hypothetical protein P153DRAFT_289062 [Dothidotthia symphoricarpi CBS 119687]|uniref:Nuclear membrane fusion protein Kar5 n=1 Tax=Dothidotthia symphoricarpi CBS 119687 TaxID=1392245 RepID=A0A6A6AFA0_9PLEO|nr:uncharacterized protein P153DRAFT_289062 [Dothidotthia symphoricarpi CBS 119687]KAF2130579.1 hypothetical protein P153DRAFT_289062 [Dothidotthia symphoricarpi CBS 119687]